MPGCCAVLGCRSRFVRGGKHFFRFPKSELFKKIWVSFTRRTDSFSVKSCSAICEDHFEPNRIVAKKKGRLYLLKQTVPTIHYRELKEGIQKVSTDFDYENFNYIGEESVDLQNMSVIDEESFMIQERRKKLKELKNLCRFCFECQDEKFVSLSKLQSYSISSNDIFAVIGIDSQFKEAFSSILCEKCFQQIVSIDGFRKRCQKAQDEIVKEIKELDYKVFGSANVNESPWYKQGEICKEEQVMEHQPPFERDLFEEKIIEEHLEDNISYVDEGYCL